MIGFLVAAASAFSPRVVLPRCAGRSPARVTMQDPDHNAMTLAATAGGIAALAGHQAMISIFFVGCKFGDAVSQTSQAFLPACYDYDESTAQEYHIGIFEIRKLTNDKHIKSMEISEF